MGILDGKVAIVTGATSGIGAAIAEKFIAEGASVVLAGRREAEGEARAAALGERAVFVRADVTVEAEVSALVDHAVGRFGRLDIMVNNAGTPGNMTPVVDFDADVFARTMAVHVGGVLLGTKHAGRVMAAQRSGSIINMASRVGKAAGYSGLDYSTAKAAVIHFTRSISANTAYGSTACRPTSCPRASSARARDATRRPRTARPRRWPGRSPRCWRSPSRSPRPSPSRTWPRRSCGSRRTAAGW